MIFRILLIAFLPFRETHTGIPLNFSAFHNHPLLHFLHEPAQQDGQENSRYGIHNAYFVFKHHVNADPDNQQRAHTGHLIDDRGGKIWSDKPGAYGDGSFIEQAEKGREHNSDSQAGRKYDGCDTVNQSFCGKSAVIQRQAALKGAYNRHGLR